MQFYKISDSFDLSDIKSSTIDIMVMSQIFKVMSKHPNFKYLDDTNGFEIVYGKNVSFASTSPTSVVFKDKKSNFLVTKSGEEFEFIDNLSQQKAWGKIQNGTLYKSLDKEQLRLKGAVDLSSLNEEERQAYQWLDSGKTGSSSKTMCATIYPKLREVHYSYKDNPDDYHTDYPYDNSDFNRCLGFLKAVPQARENLSKVGEINLEWSNLIKNWQTIENHLAKGEHEESYDLIKVCTNRDKKIAANP